MSGSALLRIGLLVDASRAYGRGICQGVARFAETRDDWLVLPHERPELSDLPAWMRKTRVDGIVAYIANRRIYRRIEGMAVSTVDVHGRCRGPGIPIIESDAEAIVRLALDFFFQSGFRHLAYCGYPSVFFSDQREAAFRNQTARLLGPAHVYAPAHSRRAGPDLYDFEKAVPSTEKELSNWLRSLPKPVAVLACNDIRAQQVVAASRESNLKVPEEVAVLGVDNDEILCRLCRPSLSSIEPDVERIGYLAAELVQAQIDKRPVKLSYRIPPRRIVQRGSTDVVVAEKADVVNAARLIRQGKADISVEQICAELNISRSTLDRLFQSHLGRSVAGEITRIRIQRGKNLLLCTELRVAEIARECGFSSSTYFCRFFRRLTGHTPNSYRQSYERE